MLSCLLQRFVMFISKCGNRGMEGHTAQLSSHIEAAPEPAPSSGMEGPGADHLSHPVAFRAIVCIRFLLIPEVIIQIQPPGTLREQRVRHTRVNRECSEDKMNVALTLGCPGSALGTPGSEL